MSASKKQFLPGYFSSLEIAESRKRYEDKISIIGGMDPYETYKNEWEDDIDLWPCVTSVHVAMYLLVTPSPYTSEDLVNYKSMDCYVNFLSGWVREVMVKAPSDHLRVVIARVSIF